MLKAFLGVLGFYVLSNQVFAKDFFVDQVSGLIEGVDLELETLKVELACQLPGRSGKIVTQAVPVEFYEVVEQPRSYRPTYYLKTAPAGISVSDSVTPRWCAYFLSLKGMDLTPGAPMRKVEGRFVLLGKTQLMVATDVERLFSNKNLGKLLTKRLQMTLFLAYEPNLKVFEERRPQD